MRGRSALGKLATCFSQPDWLFPEFSCDFSRFQALFALSAPARVGPAQALERSEAPARYQWDLKALYADEAAWAAGKQELVQSLPALGARQGKLGASTPGAK